MYAELVDENPESKAFIHGLLSSENQGNELVLSEESVLATLAKITETHPRSHAASLLALKHSSGSVFAKLLDAYLIQSFRKGVPSLFNTLKDLMKDTEKEQHILQIVLGYSTSIRECGQFTSESKGYSN